VGVAKHQAEYLWAQYGIELTIARFFAFVREDLPRDTHFAIRNFIRDSIEQTEFIVNGNGSPIRSYMHQGDLSHWLITLLQRGAPNNAYNVGSDEAICITDLDCLVRNILSPEKQVQIKGGALADKISRSRYTPDISRAKNQLGLKVTLPLTQAIQLSVAE